MPKGMFDLGPVGKSKSGGGGKKKRPAPTHPKNQGRFKYNKYKIDKESNGMTSVKYEDFQLGYR